MVLHFRSTQYDSSDHESSLMNHSDTNQSVPYCMTADFMLQTDYKFTWVIGTPLYQFSSDQYFNWRTISYFIFLDRIILFLYRGCNNKFYYFRAIVMQMNFVFILKMPTKMNHMIFVVLSAQLIRGHSRPPTS